MNYPEDNLYRIIEANNKKARINRNTVVVRANSMRTDPKKEKYRTSITIDSLPKGPYYGPETVNYDKYDMTEYSKLYPLVIPRDAYTNTWELIPAIETQYGFKLRREDIVQGPPTPQRGLKIANLCILYEGIIRLVYEEDLDLEDVIIRSDLDGFKQEILDE